jgi:hypothetical protein
MSMMDTMSRAQMAVRHRRAMEPAAEVPLETTLEVPQVVTATRSAQQQVLSLRPPEALDLLRVRKVASTTFNFVQDEQTFLRAVQEQ